MQAYLEDFYAYTQALGGATAEVMGEILRVRVFFARTRTRTRSGYASLVTARPLGLPTPRGLCASSFAGFVGEERRSVDLSGLGDAPWPGVEQRLMRSVRLVPVGCIGGVGVGARVLGRRQFEADRRAINITINSLGTELTKARQGGGGMGRGRESLSRESNSGGESRVKQTKGVPNIFGGGIGRIQKPLQRPHCGLGRGRDSPPVLARQEGRAELYCSLGDLYPEVALPPPPLSPAGASPCSAHGRGAAAAAAAVAAARKPGRVDDGAAPWPLLGGSLRPLDAGAAAGAGGLGAAAGGGGSNSVTWQCIVKAGEPRGRVELEPNS